MVRIKLLSQRLSVSERVGGRAGVKVVGEGGEVCQVGSGVGGFAFGDSVAPAILGAESGDGVTGRDGLVGESRSGPFSRASASRIMPCRRCSCEEMKGASWRSPVQRVMSTQSRDWLRRVRSWERGGRRSGLSGESWRCVGGWVLRRRYSDCCEVG